MSRTDCLAVGIDANRTRSARSEPEIVLCPIVTVDEVSRRFRRSTPRTAIQGNGQLAFTYILIDWLKLPERAGSEAASRAWTIPKEAVAAVAKVAVDVVVINVVDFAVVVSGSGG